MESPFRDYLMYDFRKMIFKMRILRYERWKGAEVKGRISRGVIDREENDYWGLVSENEFIIVLEPGDGLDSVFFNGMDKDGDPIFTDAWDSPDVEPPYRNYFEALADYHRVIRGMPPNFLLFKDGLKIIPNGRL